MRTGEEEHAETKQVTNCCFQYQTIVSTKKPAAYFYPYITPRFINIHTFDLKDEKSDQKDWLDQVFHKNVCLCGDVYWSDFCVYNPE